MFCIQFFFLSHVFSRTTKLDLLLVYRRANNEVNLAQRQETFRPSTNQRPVSGHVIRLDQSEGQTSFQKMVRSRKTSITDTRKSPKIGGGSFKEGGRYKYELFKEFPGFNQFSIHGQRHWQALAPSPVHLDPKPNPNQSQIKIQVQSGLGCH